MKGYTYILECSDGSYYTGSIKDIVKRFQQHQKGEGANHTKKRLDQEQFLVFYYFKNIIYSTYIRSIPYSLRL